MGKIGNYEYPDLKVEEALQIIEILDSQFSRKVNSSGAFAQALGHKSANSGAFFYKIADLRKYGLLMPRGNIEITPLGVKLVHPNTPQERESALKEMIENVDFFKQLYSALGNKSAGANLHLILQDKFGVERTDAQNSAPKIRNIYNKILPYMSKSERGSIHKVDSMNAPTPQNTPEQAIPIVDTENYYQANVDGIKLFVPKELDKLELAKILIERWEKKLKTDKPKEGKQHKVSTASNTTAE